MPASKNVVSIDQAKEWAKRLLKAAPTLSTLAKTQEAVASMLGHASWHALVAFYSTPPATAPSAASPIVSFEETMSQCLARINAKYPGIDATRVEVLARETDEMEGSPSDLVDRVRELINEGYFSDDALEKALEDLSVRIHAPPGYIMVRVETGTGRKVMTVISTDEYSGSQT